MKNTLMKKTIAGLALLAMASMTTGCILPGGNGGDPTAPPGWEVGGDNQPALEAIFVAGHLGNYMDCPGDGYSEASGDDAGRAAPADGDFAAGDCAPAEDGGGGCFGPLNCEQAQLTIKLVNSGDTAGTAISIERIALLDANGAVTATLPLIGAVDTATGEDFEGTLEAGADVTLRVDYQGPADITEFLPDENRWNGSAILEVTFGSDNHPDVVIETKAVEVLPAVVT
jgi:hypothetical protein